MTRRNVHASSTQSSMAGWSSLLLITGLTTIGVATFAQESDDVTNSFSWRVQLGDLEVQGRWESNMQRYGRVWGQQLQMVAESDLDAALTLQYYDAQWVFEQISEYLQEPDPWLEYAEAAEEIYVNRYLRPSNFRAQGFRRFPHGLLSDFQRSGDITLEEIGLLRDRPAFSNLSEYRNKHFGACESMSREVAYALQAHVVAEKAGLPRLSDQPDGLLSFLLRWMEAHFYQWQQGHYGEYDSDCQQAESFRFAPFMAGLSLHALIEFVDWESNNNRDPNLLWSASHWPTIETMIDEFLIWLHAEATVQSGPLQGQLLWVEKGAFEATFRYQDRGNSENTAPAWDVGNLIAPAYGWLGYQFAQSTSIDDKVKSLRMFEIGDKLFAGNVLNAWIEGQARTFNQTYRWSFDYVRWRVLANEAIGN